jgi:hypothetical protein
MALQSDHGDTDLAGQFQLRLRDGWDKERQSGPTIHATIM